MVADLMREATRRGMLNLKNCSQDASVLKSKKGQTKKSGTPGNTGLKGSNAIWSLTPLVIPSTSP